ncbi:MAG: protein kinase family protein [Jiangellaceae bacterium]
MSEPAVGPGRVLAARYRVEDLLDEAAGVRSWRAFDVVLSRAVLLQTLPASDLRAGQVTDAARAAAMVRDSRFLQVLDVDLEGDVAYVVREWMSGRDLTMLLADGPLNPAQAGALAREVAAALTTAHHDGLTHLQLRPACILITPSGGVKVAGLATEAVVHGPPPGDPGEVDAAGIGRVLYAALTGRWPGGGERSLPEAPRIDGRYASPRQVRPGVPRLLDEVADRTLGNAGRHHAPPLRSPAAVFEALTTGSSASRANGLIAGFADTQSDVGSPPAVLDEPPVPLPATRAVPVVAPREPPAHRSGPVGRAIGIVAGLMLLAGATLVGLQLLLSAVGGEDGDDGEQPAAGGTTSVAPSTPPAEPVPLTISSATAFDPEGDGDENNDEADLAIDGDASTTWRTQTYFDPMEDQKDGVGLYVDLGSALSVRAVNLELDGDDSDLEIRIVPEGATEPPDDIDDWSVAGGLDAAGITAQVILDEPVATRYVLVWFTRLPPDGGDFRGGVAEVGVLG